MNSSSSFGLFNWSDRPDRPFCLYQNVTLATDKFDEFARKRVNFSAVIRFSKYNFRPIRNYRESLRKSWSNPFNLPSYARISRTIDAGPPLAPQQVHGSPIGKAAVIKFDVSNKTRGKSHCSSTFERRRIPRDFSHFGCAIIGLFARHLARPKCRAYANNRNLRIAPDDWWRSPESSFSPIPDVAPVKRFCRNLPTFFVPVFLFLIRNESRRCAAVHEYTRSVRRWYVGRLWDGVETKWNVPENNCVINSTRRDCVETTPSDLPRWLVRFFFQFFGCVRRRKKNKKKLSQNCSKKNRSELSVFLQ